MVVFLDFIKSYLESHDFSPKIAQMVTALIAVFFIVLISSVIGYLCRRFVLSWIKRLILRSKTELDDFLIKHKVLDKAFYLIPAFVFFFLSKYLLANYSTLKTFFLHTTAVVIILIFMSALQAGLDVLLSIYYRYGLHLNFPVKSFVQVGKVVIFIVGGILIISTIFNKTPVYILSGMGALTAVLMLVFKDPILGLVAGIHLTKNDMVRVGDWIEMPKYDADGDVIDLSLTTVKVRNWDKTVTTVPAYALISDSFKNWRYMSSSGGRRIKRAFYIDTNSIKFCSDEMLSRYGKIEYIADYIAARQAEIIKYNQNNKVDLRSPANGRRMTNIGVLRTYMETYLRHHPMINKQLTLMVRQLEPTPDGLPIEVYCFSSDTAWVKYEGIQSDIYDHFIAVVPEFDLRLFQRPSGADFAGKLRG